MKLFSVKKVLILTADLSPKWWVGTSDRTGQNSLKLVHSLLKSGHDRKKITSEIMQCIRTIFVFETVNCFLDVFFKSPKILAYYTFLRQFHYYGKLHFVQYRFLLRPGHGPIHRGEGGRKKPKLREERRNERHKSSENAQEK